MLVSMTNLVQMAIDHRDRGKVLLTSKKPVKLKDRNYKSVDQVYTEEFFVLIYKPLQL